MPTTENTTSNAGGVTIVKKPIPRKYQTFSFRLLNFNGFGGWPKSGRGFGGGSC